MTTGSAELSRLMEKMGSAEGLSPFAGSLRVSLKYNFFPFLTRKGAKAIVERVFQRPVRDTKQARRGWSKRGAGAAMLVWLVLSTACGSQATADTTSRSLAFDHASRGALHLFGFGTTGAVIPNGTRHLTEEQCSAGFGELDEAIHLEPRLEFAYTSRASAYMALGEHARAIEDLTTVIELQPQEAWLQATYLQRAPVHSLMGSTDRARQDWAAQARLGPGPGSLDEYVRLRAELPPAFDCAAVATLATRS